MIGKIDSYFTIKNKKTFLLGISYYGGCGATEDFILEDLDEMKKYSFNWIRVWATWNGFGKDVSCVDTEGNIREPFFSRLKFILKECTKREMIVDITLSKKDEIVGGKRFKNFESHLNACINLVKNLTDFKNYYIDVANEGNLKDERHISFEELKIIRDEIKKINKEVFVTASYSGDMNIETMSQYIVYAEIDFLAIHRPRTPKSPEETGKMTKEYIKMMKKLGKIIPLNYQEPFRRGFNKDWEPDVSHFLKDLLDAKKNGAAGWCFHNGDQRTNLPDRIPRRSFDLTEKRLFIQLDDVEKEFLNKIRDMKPIIHLPQ
ncbi:MAG: hypothetical protein NZ891_06780 [bacterium]|nr:hypothetical protein [bacterium]MDW8164429.1 hypothetical protein [Candidatus Omnitrophota bacterium]